MSIRDELRQKALKKVNLRREKFTYDGSDYEIVEPTMGEYNKIKSRATEGQENLIWTLLRLTVAPNTNERVFEDTDYKLFLDKAFGDDFIEAASDALVKIYKSMGAIEGKD